MAFVKPRLAYSESTMATDLDLLVGLYDGLLPSVDAYRNIMNIARLKMLTEEAKLRLAAHPYTDFLKKKKRGGESIWTDEGKRLCDLFSVTRNEDSRTASYTSADTLVTFQNANLSNKLRNKTTTMRPMMKEMVQLRFQYRRSRCTMISNELMEGSEERDRGEEPSVIEGTELWFKVSAGHSYEALKSIIRLQTTIPGDFMPQDEDLDDVDEGSESSISTNEEAMDVDSESTKASIKRVGADEPSNRALKRTKDCCDSRSCSTNCERDDGSSDDSEEELTLDFDALGELGMWLQVGDCSVIDLLYFLLAFPYFEEEWEIDHRILDAIGDEPDQDPE